MTNNLSFSFDMATSFKPALHREICLVKEMDSQKKKKKKNENIFISNAS